MITINNSLPSNNHLFSVTSLTPLNHISLTFVDSFLLTDRQTDRQAHKQNENMTMVMFHFVVPFDRLIE